MLRLARAHVGLAKVPQLLLEGRLLSLTKLLKLSGREDQIHAFFDPLHGLFIERFDLPGPRSRALRPSSVNRQFVNAIL
jgi:hypothetical protein